jgi:hypothetical protein
MILFGVFLLFGRLIMIIVATYGFEFMVWVFIELIWVIFGV